MDKPIGDDEKVLNPEGFFGRGPIENEEYGPRSSIGTEKEGDIDDGNEKAGALEGAEVIFQHGGQSGKEKLQDASDVKGNAVHKDSPPDLGPSSPEIRAKNSGTLAILQRSRSHGDGHGYIAHRHVSDSDDEDADQQEQAAKQTDEEHGDRKEKEFEVRWDGEEDPMNPRNLGLGRKWMIVLVVSMGSTCVTCTSSMYTSTYDQITVEFGVSRVVATLGLSLFVMGLGLGPMMLGMLAAELAVNMLLTPVTGPLSEFYGRRPIYVVSFAFFLIWLVRIAILLLLTCARWSRFF